MPAVTRAWILVVIAVILGTYLLGFAILGFAAVTQRYELVAVGLAALAVGLTASFALKAFAIFVATVPGWRRLLSLTLWAIPAVGFWALAAQQIRG